ncbi:MAG: hypothetical protein JNK27_03285 [Chitinophagaceae bacterium]|nr:hypothetical protein [Chitinophagaceae bacterium]
MNAKSTIRKVLFVVLWLCIGGAMFTLLMAAISKRNKGLCNNYSITIKGVQSNYFIDKKDVEQLLKKTAKGNIKGQLVSDINLHELENMLESNTWISDAELYFDNKDVLHVAITEKEPVARIFSTDEKSFYIDKEGERMPLSEKLSARVPVFTGFPDKKKLSAADSVLLRNVTAIANYIFTDSFWLAQVAQIDITPERSFEMIPVVGNHIVKMGEGENIEKQFNRLMIFYIQVLSKTGFDKYKIIDVQYAGQVVASRYAGNAKIDSVQLRRNVDRLLQQSREAESDTVIKVLPVIQELLTDDDNSNAFIEEAKTISVKPENKPADPNPSKSSSVSKPVEKKDAKPVEKKEEKKKPVKANKSGPPDKKPKAVMPPKIMEDSNGGYN